MKINYMGKWVYYHRITSEERQILDVPKDHKWMLDTSFLYHSERYNESIWCNEGETSDGATGAFDVLSIVWWVHDKICVRGTWESGRKIANFEASTVVFDILKSEGRIIRDFWWFAVTFLFGGGEARKNGTFTLKA